MVCAINRTRKKEVHSYNATLWMTRYHSKGNIDNLHAIELGVTKETSANSVTVSCLERSAVELAGGETVLWSSCCTIQRLWKALVHMGRGRRVEAQALVHFALLKGLHTISVPDHDTIACNKQPHAEHPTANPPPSQPGGFSWVHSKLYSAKCPDLEHPTGTTNTKTYLKHTSW